MATQESIEAVQQPQKHSNALVQQAVRVTLASPLTITKDLVQVGFEPFPEVVGKGIFGIGYRRPGFLAFCKFLYKKGGVPGLFVGVDSRLCGAITNSFVTEYLQDKTEQIRAPKANETDIACFSRNVALDVVCNSIATAVSYPFYVIGLRTVSEWVFGDGVFRNVFSATRDIYQAEGLSGFIAGIVPAVLQESLYVVSMSCTVRLLHMALAPYVTHLEKEAEGAVQFGVHMLAVSMTTPIFFPFSTAKALMAVNVPHLCVARRVPMLNSFVDALYYLHDLNGFGPRGLLRGNGVFRRFYSKPLKQ